MERNEEGNPNLMMNEAVLHDGERVPLRIEGCGPTILMHPQPAWPTLPAELLENKRALDEALVTELRDRFRLVMFEYPRTPKPQTLTPSNVVRDLLAIADAAEAERFAWCGYSWTAVIGIQLAISTDRLTALVCGGWPPVAGPYGRMLELVTTAGNEQMVTFYRELQAFDDRKAQWQITCPRLCMVGDRDDAAGSGIARRVLEKRAVLEQLGWDVRVLPGLDHVEPLRPRQFTSVVAGWLDGVLAD